MFLTDAEFRALEEAVSEYELSTEPGGANDDQLDATENLQLLAEVMVKLQTLRKDG